MKNDLRSTKTNATVPHTEDTVSRECCQCSKSRPRDKHLSVSMFKHERGYREREKKNVFTL